jgi:hypothetical protein
LSQAAALPTLPVSVTARKPASARFPPAWPPRRAVGGPLAGVSHPARRMGPTKMRGLPRGLAAGAAWRKSSSMSDPENTGRKQDGTFAPGRSGNLNGKPKGTRHRATMLAEKLLDKDAGAIIKTLVEKARAGEPWAVRFVAERIIPPARDRATPFALPPVNGPADLPQAVQAALDAAAKGDLSLEDAERVVGLLNGLRAAYEGADLAARLDEMAAKLDALATKAGQG